MTEFHSAVDMEYAAVRGWLQHQKARAAVNLPTNEASYITGWDDGYQASQQAHAAQVAAQAERIAALETALQRISELRDAQASDMYDAHYRKGVRDARYHTAHLADVALAAAPRPGGG